MTSIQMMMKALDIGKIKNDDEKADAMKALLKEWEDQPSYKRPEPIRYFTPEEAKAAIEATAATVRRFANLVAETSNPYLREVLSHAVGRLSKVALMLEEGGGIGFIREL